DPVGIAGTPAPNVPNRPRDATRRIPAASRPSKLESRKVNIFAVTPTCIVQRPMKTRDVPVILRAIVPFGALTIAGCGGSGGGTGTPITPPAQAVYFVGEQVSTATFALHYLVLWNLTNGQQVQVISSANGVSYSDPDYSTSKNLVTFVANDP